MSISKEQITDILKDLEQKHGLLEDKELNGVPAEYVGMAVYGYVIRQLKGLID